MHLSKSHKKINKLTSKSVSLNNKTSNSNSITPMASRIDHDSNVGDTDNILKVEGEQATENVNPNIISEAEMSQF